MLVGFSIHILQIENDAIRFKTTRLILTVVCLVSVFVLVFRANSSATKIQMVGVLKYPQLA